MKAVILAAGYGTRLQRDVENDTTGTFGHLIGTPKPLLPVGHCALISHWVRALSTSGCVDAIFVVTNKLYHRAFEDWARPFANVRILSDGTQSNAGTPWCCCVSSAGSQTFPNRGPCVGDRRACVMRLASETVHSHRDTLFKEDFSLCRFTDEFSALVEKCDDSNLVLSYQCKHEETVKYGILEVGADLRVACMKEKPRPSDTPSRRACPCFYLLSKKSIPLLDAFLDEKKNAPIEERDAPGNFLSWLISRKAVYVHEVSGRFDVGNLSSYLECDAFFKEHVSDLHSYLQ